MAHLLKTNPDLCRHVQFWRKSGQMVPLVQDGEFQGFVNRSSIHLCPAPYPLPVADFILGMEAMGHRFAIGLSVDGSAERLQLVRDIDDEPESWRQRTSDLLRRFGQGRGAEGIAFLRARDVQQEAAA